MDVSGQLDAPVALTPVRAPGTLWIGGWVDPGASLGTGEGEIFPFPGIEPRTSSP
jgi:hypothetical protein